MGGVKAMTTETLFGPYPRSPDLGQLLLHESQSMQYKATDRGPYHLSPEERDRQRHDRVTGKKTKKNKTKAMVLEDLKQLGMNGVSGTAKHLQEIAEQNNIPLFVEEDEVIKGWEGKPKGMLQILWERGWIDEEKPPDYYTIDGRKDVYGNIIPSTSLKLMITRQMDFVQEETLLQYHGRKLGVTVDRTPKCHPEMAGEGVEYNWGCAKGVYRRLPMTEKRTKTKFRQSAKLCISREIMTTERQRFFSRRARQYMMVYNAIDNNIQEDHHTTTTTNTGGNEQQPAISMMMIEKILKTYKTHRNIADSDKGYIDGVVDTMKMAVFMNNVSD